jgi:hypothetical protein
MIRLITTTVIIILVLSFFGISIRSIVESPTGKDNLTFVFQIIHTGWNILYGYVFTIWHNIQSIGDIVGSSQK